MTKSRSNATAPNAKGTLVVGSGTDASTTLAVGTDGYYLTADSAEASGVKWAAASAGGMTLLGSGTLSGSTVTLSSIPSTYVDLVIYVNSIVQNTTPEFVTLRLNNSTTNAAVTTIYSTSLGHNSPSGPVYIGSGDSAYRLNTTGANAFAIRITNYAAAKRKAIQGFGSYKYSTDVNQIGWHLYGGSTDEVAYDRIDIVTAAGNFTAGNYAIYGVK